MKFTQEETYRMAELLRQYQNLVNEKKKNTISTVNGQDYLKKEIDKELEAKFGQLTDREHEILEARNLTELAISAQMQSKKKEATEGAEMTRKIIDKIISDKYDSLGEKHLISDEAIFQGIGKIQWSVEKVPALNLDSVDKRTLINSLLDLGYDNIITINEEEYLKLNEDFKQQTGQNLMGIESVLGLKTKISSK